MVSLQCPNASIPVIQILIDYLLAYAKLTGKTESDELTECKGIGFPSDIYSELIASLVASMVHVWA